VRVFATNAVFGQTEEEATRIEHEYEDEEEEFYAFPKMKGKNRKFLDLVDTMITEEGKKKDKAIAKIEKNMS